MKVEQGVWRRRSGWSFAATASPADLVLVFGSTSAMADTEACRELFDRYPEALLVGCSTAGEIEDVNVHDGTLVATAVAFESTRVAGRRVEIPQPGDSRRAARELARGLQEPGLCHVLVLSDGLGVNGSELVAGLTDELPSHVSISGGLAGDGENLGRTSVLFEREIEPRVVVGVGFYGDRLQVGCGSLGGWDPFGPERRITRAEGNVLYELDGQSALELYKKFLGDKAAELPTSALLFPLSLRSPDGSTSGVVRTVLAIDEETQSMTFAGDLGEGWYAQLMKANFERLIDGAMGAAKICADHVGQDAELALLVSCVGRKLVLKQRIEEEVEAVREVLGERPMLTGFYSLGEISPFSTSSPCELHNQTMTIATFSEI